jgi:uncharacterized beta-barrel protein YwiB (DUF1934 family)
VHFAKGTHHTYFINFTTFGLLTMPMKFFLLPPKTKKGAVHVSNHNSFLHFQYDVNTHNTKKERKKKRS